MSYANPNVLTDTESVSKNILDKTMKIVEVKSDHNIILNCLQEN